MTEFAKLLNLPDVGQVLVKIDRSDDSGKPEIRWYVKPAGWGVLSFAVSFPDNDKGWDAAEALFESADEAKARTAVDQILHMLPDLDE